MADEILPDEFPTSVLLYTCGHGEACTVPSLAGGPDPAGRWRGPVLYVRADQTHASDDPAALRQQNAALCGLLLEQTDMLRAVRRYAEECRARAGATVDPATVAARLWQILAGLDLSCPRCAAREIAGRRHAEMILGLADLQRAGG